MFFNPPHMKKINIILMVLAGLNVQAQTDSSETGKPQFKLSINYNSALNYYGRTDSLKSTGFFPLAELWFSKNVYVSAAPVFVSNQAQALDYAGTVTTLGYLNAGEKWITNLYAMKPFYEKSSQLVQSALKAQAGASFSYLNPILNLTAGGDIKFSDKIDFGATAGIDHLIRKENSNGGVWVIDPSFYAYAGTQNFSQTYYRKNNFLLFPAGSSQVTENVQSFNILAYEFSLPLIYSKDKWMVMANPAYILPRNLVTVPNRPDLSERGQNMFYATLCLKRTF